MVLARLLRRKVGDQDNRAAEFPQKEKNFRAKLPLQFSAQEP